MADTFHRVCNIIVDALSLDRQFPLTHDTALFGELPEFDSMAVVSVLTMIEQDFDLVIEDDDISAEVFASVGTLTQFVASKVQG